MSDNIFHEVDEEVRRERLKQLWDRYGIYLIALAFLFVAGIGGWRGYETWQNKKASETAAAFEAAMTLNDEGKKAEAEKAFSQIAKDGTPGYQLLARFRAAAAEGDRKDAVQAYDTLTSSAIGRTMEDLAALRAGYLLLDTASFDEMLKRLEPLTAASRPFRYSARELLAFSAWRSGDVASAKRFIDMIVTDGEAPQGVRSRVDVLAALIAADGKN